MGLFVKEKPTNTRVQLHVTVLATAQLNSHTKSYKEIGLHAQATSSALSHCEQIYCKVLFLFSDPVKKISLGVSNLDKSLDYWHRLLGMTVHEKTDTKATLGYDANQCKLELVQLEGAVDHATAFGRIAFACPFQELPSIESSAKAAGHTILTPLVSLDTPGKATVQVVILADPVRTLVVVVVVVVAVAVVVFVAVVVNVVVAVTVTVVVVVFVVVTVAVVVVFVAVVVVVAVAVVVFVAVVVAVAVAVVVFVAVAVTVAVAVVVTVAVTVVVAVAVAVVFVAVVVAVTVAVAVVVNVFVCQPQSCISFGLSYILSCTS